MEARSLTVNETPVNSTSFSSSIHGRYSLPSHSPRSIDPGAAILNMSCDYDDTVIPRLTNFIGINGGAVTNLQHYIDDHDRTLFVRVEWNLRIFRMPAAELHSSLSNIADNYRSSWNLHYSNHIPRMAVLASMEPHCLCEIISRIQSGEWLLDIPVIISNHRDLRRIAELNGIPFHFLPITSQNKNRQEIVMQDILKAYDIDFIVLARYMQILGDDIVESYRNRIINVHHSLLPAFPGSRPYHAAHIRGVKVVGATSHYVTSELDAGPIIEQEVTRVSHNYTVHDLMQAGKNLERLVLSRAITKHLQHKIMVKNNRTVVFQ